jgi:hypothetical protein
MSVAAAWAANRTLLSESVLFGAGRRAFLCAEDRGVAVLVSRRSKDGGKTTMSKLRGFLPVLVLAVIAMLALGQIASGKSTAAQATRQDLAAGKPSFAPGYRLSLMRIIIPVGVELAPHRHPGMQTARVISGRLEYRVFRGTVTVYRGPAGVTKKAVRTITAGHAAVIETGQWIAETPGLWHAGSNPGKKPTVILSAALLKANKSVSIPVKP